MDSPANEVRNPLEVGESAPYSGSSLKPERGQGICGAPPLRALRAKTHKINGLVVCRAFVSFPETGFLASFAWGYANQNPQKWPERAAEVPRVINLDHRRFDEEVGRNDSVAPREGIRIGFSCPCGIAYSCCGPRGRPKRPARSPPNRFRRGPRLHGRALFSGPQSALPR